MSHDRRVRRTKKLLKHSLFELLHEKKWEHISVKDITERADINRATFYQHYNDKYDLLQQNVDEMLNLLAKTINPPQVQSEQQLIEVLIKKKTPLFAEFFEHIANHLDFYKVILEGKGGIHFERKFKKFIYRTFYEGLLTLQPDDKNLKVPREILVHYITSAHIGLLSWWVENDLPYSPRYMSEQLRKMIILGPYEALGYDAKLKIEK